MNSLAPPVLQPLRALFDAAVTALAADCARGGKLDATRLDELQLASYEMAWAGADLLAAETLAAAVRTWASSTSAWRSCLSPMPPAPCCAAWSRCSWN